MKSGKYLAANLSYYTLLATGLHGIRAARADCRPLPLPRGGDCYHLTDEREISNMKDNTVWAIISLLFGLWNGYSAVVSYSSGNMTWALIDTLLAALMIWYFIRAWQTR